MKFKKIINMFNKGNVCVTGLRGDGKDMLISNVVYRRKKPYVCNVDYKCKYSPYIAFNPMLLDVGNTHDNFISGNIKPYTFPYIDGTDIYISDAGVYFPSQFCNELNKKYSGIVNFMQLSRHLGKANVHCNTQNLNRLWDKIREQSDLYIRCEKCIVFLGFVFQIVTIYESYDSCVKRVPPFPLKRPVFNKDRQLSYDLAKANYQITHGKVERHILFYRNKSKYDTRAFKTMLSQNAIQQEAIREAVTNDVLSRVEILKGGDKPC